MPQLILSASGKQEPPFLNSLLLSQTDVTGSREKKLQANSLPPSGRASPCLFLKKEALKELCAQLEKQLLRYLPLSLQSYLIKFMPFLYASLLVFADIREISIVCHSQIMCV